MFSPILVSRRLIAALTLCVGFISLAAAGPIPAGVPPAYSGMMHYQSPEDESYDVLILPALQRPASVTSRDHVLIIDTSASQTGEFRTRSLSIINEICRDLPPTDRLNVLASDIGCESMTGGWVTVGSPQLQAGLASLADRLPLGASDLGLACATAIKSFDGNQPNRSLVYIGDGFSSAKLIPVVNMATLTTELRQHQIPFNSLAIGPRTDLMLLGSLAQHTGGLLIADHIDVNRPENGLSDISEQIRFAMLAPVFYPKTLVSTPLIPGVMPANLPPVRFDRETVLLTKGLDSKRAALTMTGTLMGRPLELSWQVKRESTAGSTRFIQQAWQMAVSTEGMAMPWAGRALVEVSQKTHLAQISNLESAAVEAFNGGDRTKAAGFARTLIQLAPDNPNARHVLFQAGLQHSGKTTRPIALVAQVNTNDDDATSEESPQLKGITDDRAAEADVPEEPQAIGTDEEDEVKASPEPVAGEPNPNEVTSEPATGVEPAPQPDPGLTGEPAEMMEEDSSNPKQESLLDELESKRRVREEQLTIDTNISIEEGYRISKEDYEAARELLKRTQNTIVADTSISTTVRRELQRRIETSLQTMQNENEKRIQIRIQKQREISATEARKKLADDAFRNEERMEQLVDRVRALLVRGSKGEETAFEDAEAVARTAVEIDPYLGVPNSAVINAEASGQLDKARRLRSLRQDKVLAVLHQVELSHVPFPDEPPILWPSPERWQWITENRRKWKSVDLKSYSKKEEKIVRELDKPTTFDFTDESLDGVVDTIKERHGFDIVLDKTKLDEESIASDATDITLKVSEISLKNALKLLLDSKNLTYVVENEVMKITTKGGEVKRPLRVYNVGDLVMPVNPLFGQGGSGVGGQSGGGGQFNGGQSGGGGQFGGGGNGFGGGGAGGGGGGGGFFNLPPFKDTSAAD